MSGQSDTAICPGCGEEMAITTELYGSELVSRGICHKCGRAARKSKRWRDNWKARYVALDAALRDDDMPYDIAYGGRQATSHLDDRFYGISDYRARLLALIDGKETT